MFFDTAAQCFETLTMLKIELMRANDEQVKNLIHHDIKEVRKILSKFIGW